MPTQIVCPLPGCGKAVMVAEADLSRSLRCPHCRQVFQLPTATLTTPPVLPTLAVQTPFVQAHTLTDPGTPVDLIPPTEPVRIGRFDIRERLGEGAFGLVYRAWDTQLEREVALKVAKPHTFNTEDRVKRFLREARAVAQLRHPNIVPLHDSGRDGEQYYFASAFIAGQSLAAVLHAQPRGLELRRAAAIVRRLAEALAYAHSKNIIHRDVKPANALLDEQGEPLLLDFGLAARADGEERLTQEATLMGTPAYMAPEQAAGHAISASDQYSLGCTFYELLTGQTPYSGPPELQIFLHQSQEPLSPRIVKKALPRDLETICLKCLARNPAERYPDCGALADDLRRWLEGEPIQARRLTLMERFGKLARRRPALVAAWGLTGLAAGLIGFAVIVTHMWQSSEFQREEAEAAERRAVIAKGLAELERHKAAVAEYKALEERTKARDAEHLARVSEQAARAAEERTAQLQYLRQVDLAHREWQDNNLVRARELLKQCDPGPGKRPWEWRYVQNLCNAQLQELRGHAKGVTSAVFTPDRRRVVSGSFDQTVKVWDLQGDQKPLTLAGHNDTVYVVAVSPDGQRIFSGGGDRTVKVWDAASGKELLTLKGHTSLVQNLACSADSQRLVSGSQDGTLKVWDARSGEELASIPTRGSSVRGVAFSPDGKRILAAGPERELSLWDIQTGQAAVTITDPYQGFLGAALSTDGSRVATCNLLGTIKLWDARSGQEIVSAHYHTGPVESLVFRPDGRALLSAGHDGQIKMVDLPDLRQEMVKQWEAPEGKGVVTWKGHTKPASSAVFSTDGKRIVSGSADGTVLVWNAEVGADAHTLRGHSHIVDGVAFNRDGTRLVSAGQDFTLKVWDTGTGQALRTLRGHTAGVTAAAFTADGKQIVSGAGMNVNNKPGEIKLWDVESGKEILDLKGHPSQVFSVAISADGMRIVSGGEDGTVRVWDVPNRKEVHVLKKHIAPVRGVALSADGKRIASASQDSTVRVWDAESGKDLLTLRGHVYWVMSVAFSLDGQRLVSGGSNGIVRLWDLRGEAPPKSLLLDGHSRMVYSVAISADGTRIISGSEDRTVKVWDVQTGQEALTLKGHTDRVEAVAISRDGTRIASAGSDATVKLWDGRERGR